MTLLAAWLEITADWRAVFPQARTRRAAGARRVGVPNM